MVSVLGRPLSVADPSKPPFAIDISDWSGTRVVCSLTVWTGILTDCPQLNAKKRVVEDLIHRGGTVKTDVGGRCLFLYQWGDEYEWARRRGRVALRLVIETNRPIRALRRAMIVTDYGRGEVDYHGV
jgi:hypothetical protein